MLRLVGLEVKTWAAIYSKLTAIQNGLIDVFRICKGHLEFEFSLCSNTYVRLVNS